MSAAPAASARLAETAVSISRERLDDLHARLRSARLPQLPAGAPELGVPLAAMRSLLDRWRDGFDWDAVEARLNRFPQVLLETADGARLHAAHRRVEGDGLPVVLLHGWGDTFASQLPVAERLAAAGHDVVVPSLPGFPLSRHAPGAATASAAAAAVHELMTALGHERYAVHGGDWGGAVAWALMTEHAESIAAAHLTDIPFHLHFLTDRDELEQHERDLLDAADARQEEPQYYRLQAGRPLTLAYAMADSPVALLAWLMNLYTAWTDHRSDADAVLTAASLYWLTDSFASSVRFYSEGTDVWESTDAGDDAESPDGAGGWDEGGDSDEWGAAHASVPAAFAIHPADIVQPTRGYAERFFAVERFTRMPSGGHFAAMEAPEPLADDLLAFLAGRH